MFSFITKIWMYLGYFYLSLGFVAFVFLLHRPKKNQLFNSFLILLVFIIGVNVFTSYKNVTAYSSKVSVWFNNFDDKMKQKSFGQTQFISEVQQQLPKTARGCILWSWDIVAQYFRQSLYPLRFSYIYKPTETEKCDYVISQFKEVPELSKYQIYQSEGGYIYKIL